MVFLDKQVIEESLQKLFSADLFVHKLITYASNKVWKSGRNRPCSFIFECRIRSVFLRASNKVGNEKKFFALRASLLNLEDGCLRIAMHTSFYSGEGNFGLSSEMRNSSHVDICELLHHAQSTFHRRSVEVFHLLTVQAQETRQE
jgi:hypothetical protein